MKNQVLDQVLYIAEDSLGNALAWEARLRDAMNVIGDAPNHAVDEDASDRVGEALRKVVFEGTYLIHYRVSNTAVEVMWFRHGAMKPRRGEP